MRAGVAGDKELTRRAAARLCGKAVRYYHPIRDEPVEILQILYTV